MPDEQTIEQRRTRYLIVGTGRSGSSLLAAVLAHAGADFGMADREEWSRRGGAYEHPLLISAYRWYRRSKRLQETFIPHPVSEYCLNRAKKDILKLSREAHYAKYPPATQIVHLFKSVSLYPVVIVSYRSFESYAASSFLRHGLTMQDLADKYVDIHRTTLLELHLCGGCVVDYGDIIDKSQVQWAHTLANLTGIDADKLLASRDEVVQKPTATTPPPPFWQEMMAMDKRPDEMYALLRSLNGEVFARRK